MAETDDHEKQDEDAGGEADGPEEGAVNDPLTRSDEEAPRTPFASEPQPEEA